MDWVVLEYTVRLEWGRQVFGGLLPVVGGREVSEASWQSVASPVSTRHGYVFR